MKTGTDFEQTSDTALNFSKPLGRARDARENLQERRLASAVSSDQSDHLASQDVERDAAHRPQIVNRLAPAVTPKRRRECACQNVAQREVACAFAHAIALAESLDANDGFAHSSNHIGYFRFHFLEICRSGQNKQNHDTRRNQEHSPRRIAVSCKRPTKSLDYARHRVQAIQPAPFLRYERTRVNYRRGEHPELYHERNDVTDIAIDRIKRRKPQTHAQRGQKGQQKKRWEPQYRSRGPCSEVDHHRNEH